MVNIAHQRTWIVAALSAGAIAAASGAQATVYDVVSGFSLASNPNGPWSYLVSDTLLTYTETSVLGVAGLDAWWNGQSIPNSVAVTKNMTGGTAAYANIRQPPNVLNLDPESLSVQVEFTAPDAGVYTIAGDFTGIDTGCCQGVPLHPVSILDNGVVVFSDTISAYLQDDRFDLTETLAAGDTITFAVGTGTDKPYPFANLSTGLNATLTVGGQTAIPEPSTWVTMLIGLAGLGFATRCRGGKDRFKLVAA